MFMTSSDLRIGMVSMDAPPFVGGMGSHVGSLAAGLRAAGHFVSVFSSADRPVATAFGAVFFSVGLRTRLATWVKREGIGMLHLHTGPGGAFVSRPIEGVPLVVTANHTYVRQSRLPFQRWKRCFVPWERATYRAADLVICISEDTADSVRLEYGIAPEKIRVVPCGFALQPWIAADVSQEKREMRHCVFVGRPQTRKGWDILCDAWRSLHAAVPDVTLHVVGFSEKNRDGIVFHGRLSDKDVRALVGRSRFLVCPSRLEGFGLAAAESIVAGTPVIATHVDGLRRVVRNGESGMLTDVSSDAVCRAMHTLFADDMLWKTLHDGCLRHRDMFDLRHEIRAHMDVYDGVYSRPR